MTIRIVILALAISFAVMLVSMRESMAAGETVTIGKWYRNHDCAVSLRFDDNRDSHVDVVVPILDRYGFKATFMVNPGNARYIGKRDFWEKEVVSKGHSLGNHTMHHRGAGTLEEAEYEIGEAAKILRSVQRDESDLMVFAAGGLTKWGGAEWEESSDSYKRLAEKFRLIDLYDGSHKAKHVHSTDNSKSLCGLVRKAMEAKTHQAFVFHDVGSPGIRDLVKLVKNGYHLTLGKESFTEFLDFLDERKERIWVAPLVRIYKYEAERDGASLTVVENKSELVRLKLKVNTDPALYDQKLTLVLAASGRNVSRILQAGEPVREYEAVDDTVLIHVRPITSDIAIHLESHHGKERQTK
ncbi:MAG TPA: polysaccharide deacetylase family protein [Nitrospiraceae bacterium]